MKNLLWSALALILSRRAVADWLIRRAQRTPYAPIIARSGDRLYMDRWWLFNPYGKTPEGRTAPAKRPKLPSIRVHHICLPDDDLHEHDHPWDARTVILRGWYVEERLTHGQETRVMTRGHTSAICAGDFHRIARVSDGGVYTLFWTWAYVEEWGFNVDGIKVPWRKYLGLD